MRKSLLLVVLAACSAQMVVPPDGGAGGACGTAVTPPNLVPDPSFECDGMAWSPQSGTVEVVTGGRSGKAVRLTATTTGSGQMGIATPLVAMTSGKAYCLSAFVSGTATDARLEVLPAPAGIAQTFSTPVTTSWVRAPMTSKLKVPAPAGRSLTLRVVLLNGQAGQTLLLDDVDFYESAGDNCTERP